MTLEERLGKIANKGAQMIADANAEEERKKVVKVTEEYEGTKNEYERVDWEETDSCWGFYGKWNKVEDWILSEAGFKKEDLEEEG